MRSFNDQCIVITGAAGGLGQALVTAFLHAHANVVALDRDVLDLAGTRMQFLLKE